MAECVLQIRIKSSLYSLYYVEKRNDFARPIFWLLCLQAAQLLQRNFAGVASRWQHLENSKLLKFKIQTPTRAG